MPPCRQRRPLAEAGSVVGMQAHDTTSVTSGAPTWYVEAEVHLREAARRLEVVGVTDADAARLAGAVYRFASRVRSDRLAAAP